MLPFRYHHPELERSSSGLQIQSNDPALPSPERSHSPFSPSVGVTANGCTGGDSFSQALADFETSDHGLHNAIDFFFGEQPNSDLPGTDEEMFNQYVDLNQAQSPRPPQMEINLSQSSTSSDSSLASKRQKSNDGSARSSFSIGHDPSGAVPTHGLQQSTLNDNAARNVQRHGRFSGLPEMESMNQMTNNLAVDSVGNSSTDSLESNPTPNNIRGMAMPHESSANLFADPRVTNFGFYGDHDHELSTVSPALGEAL